MLQAAKKDYIVSSLVEARLFIARSQEALLTILSSNLETKCVA